MVFWKLSFAGFCSESQGLVAWLVVLCAQGSLAVQSQGNPFSGPVCCEVLYESLSSQHGRLLRTWFIMESVLHVQASTEGVSSAISNIQSALGHYKAVHF